MRQAMELVDQLRHEAKDSKGGAADGGGNQGEGEGEEKRAIIEELERVRLELDASEGARRELEAAVAAADQETHDLRERLADFEGELRRGEFAGSLNDRSVSPLSLSLSLSLSLPLALPPSLSLPLPVSLFLSFSLSLSPPLLLPLSFSISFSVSLVHLPP
jgi:hypothetical protein